MIILVSTNKKKISAFKAVNQKISGKTLKGVIVADKIGEVRFVSRDNLDKTMNGSLEENDEDGISKLLFSHYEDCLSVLFSEDEKFLISTDSMHRVSPFSFQIFR